METISQMATSASKFAFGDSSNQEPLSGAQGDVNKGEPYDAGNLDPNDQERVRQSLRSETRDADSSDGAYTTDPSQNTGPITTATNATNDAGFTHPQHDMSAPGFNASDEGMRGGDMGGARSSDNNNNTSGGAAVRSFAYEDMTARKGQDRHDDDAAAAGKVDDSKHQSSEVPATEEEENPDVPSGSGPRDLSTVAREKGGDAGTSESKSRSSGGDNNNNDDKNEEDGDKGTGEMYVKSSGLQADGGDFDATKPGAGREADRLMERKGISPTEAGNGGGGGSGGDTEQHHKSPSGGSEGKDKHGMMDKIKEKLHKH